MPITTGSTGGTGSAETAITKLFPEDLTPSTGTGTVTLGIATQLVDGVSLADDDATAVTVFTSDTTIPNSFANDTNIQVKLLVARDTVNAAHTIRINYKESSSTDGTEAYFDIGSGATTFLIGATNDSGNYTGTWSATEILRGNDSFIEISTTITSSATEDALEVVIDPVVNLVGDATPVVTAVGSVDLASFVYGAPSELAAGGLETIRVDASGSAQALSLDPATGSNTTIIYTLVDGTNGATVVPAGGENINGVTDATFTFSNYSAGTQFLATDRATGEWDISVVGASTSTSLGRYAIRGALANYNITTGINVLPISTLEDTLAEAGAVASYTESDPQGWRSGDTLTVPAGVDGTYSVSLEVNHSAGNIAGAATTAAASGTAWAGLKINGTDRWFAFDSGAGVPDIMQATFELVLAEGDTLQVITEGTAEVNEDFLIGLTLHELPSTETVLAGHVVPTDLVDYEVYLAADQDLSGNNTWEDVTGVSITPAAGKYLLIGECYAQTSNADIAEVRIRIVDELDALVSSELAVLSYDNTGNAATDKNVGGTATSTKVITTDGTKTYRMQALQPNNDQLRNIKGDGFKTNMRMVGLPNQTVVNPGSVPVEDLHFVSLNTTGHSSSLVGSNSDLVDLDDADLVTYDPQSLINATNDSVVISQAGLYEITFMHTPDTGANEKDLEIRLNGVAIASGNKNTQDGPDDITMSATVIKSLIIGDEITFYANAPARTVSIVVKQLAQKTITALDPAFTEAKDLEDVTIALEGGNTTAVSDGTYFRVPFNATRSSNGSLVVSDGKVTVKSNNRYELTAFVGTTNEAELAFWDFTNNVALSDSYNNNDAVNTRGSMSAILSTSSDIQVGVVTRLGEIILGNGTFGTLSAGGTNSWMTVKQLPSTEYVTPGDVPVEDVSETIFSGTPVSAINGTQQTWANGLTWADIEANYEFIEMLVPTSIHATPIRVHVPGVSNLAGYGTASPLSIEAGKFDARYVIIHIVTQPTDTTFSLSYSGVTVAGPVEIIGLKAQKTVINSNDMTVNDQAASGFMDFGTMRMQWGVATSANGAAATITFPQPFGAAGASVTGSVAGIAARIVSFVNVTATDFDVAIYQPATFAIEAHDFSWQAIGLRP